MGESAGFLGLETLYLANHGLGGSRAENAPISITKLMVQVVDNGMSTIRIGTREYTSVAFIVAFRFGKWTSILLEIGS